MALCKTGRFLSIVTGVHWTESPNKSIDQIAKNCPENVRKLSKKCLKIVFSSTIFGHFSDIFSAFFGHFVDIPFFWAIQRFARYNLSKAEILGVGGLFPSSKREGGDHVHCTVEPSPGHMRKTSSKLVGVDIHDLKAWTSVTPGGLKEALISRTPG